MYCVMLLSLGEGYIREGKKFYSLPYISKANEYSFGVGTKPNVYEVVLISKF